MSERNGPDIAAVYQLLTEVARIVGEHTRRFDQIDRRLAAHDHRFDEHDRRFVEQGSKINELVATLNEHGRVLGDIAAAVNRHEAKLDDLAASQNSLRESLTLYYSAVVGHGIAMSDLDERVRRIERHLNLEPTSR